MGSQAQSEKWYFVPEGKDPLLVHIEHDLDFITLSSGEDIYITLNYLSGESVILFSAEDLLTGYPQLIQ